MENGNHQVSALLESGCQFEGKLTFEGTVRINGHFSGEIFSEGTLVVGEGALVEGQIGVGNVIINGKVQGEIVAKERIEMNRPAEVRANITAKTLVIEEGVVFAGNCQMGERDTQESRLEKTAHDRAIDAASSEDVTELHADSGF